jgi:hypothetical protein
MSEGIGPKINGESFFLSSLLLHDLMSIHIAPALSLPFSFLNVVEYPPHCLVLGERFQPNFR